MRHTRCCTQIDHSSDLVIQDVEFTMNLKKFEGRSCSKALFFGESIVNISFIFRRFAHLERKTKTRRAFYTSTEDAHRRDKETKRFQWGFFDVFFSLGRSKTSFMPPPCSRWNFIVDCLSVVQAALSRAEVSWSIRCVYFVRPAIPKFFTCITLGKIVLSKWSSSVGAV